MKLKVFLIISFLFLGLVYVAPKEGFWTTDSGNKFIQVQNISASGKLAIPYQAEAIDKDKVFFPYCGHHFQKEGEQVYSFYPPYFPYISSFFYKAFGTGGIYIIPVISGILCLLLTMLMLKFLSINSYLSQASPVILGLCTPIFFYSLVFWEHTLSVFLFISAIFILIKNIDRADRKVISYIYAAGILTGLSTVFREESYIATAALFTALLFTDARKKAIPLTAGWLTAMIPLWLFQKYMFGYFTGIHAAVYGKMTSGSNPLMYYFHYDTLIEKFSNFYVYLFKFIPTGMTPLIFGILMAPFVISVFAGIITKNSEIILKSKMTLLFLNFVSSIVMFSFLCKSPCPVFDTLFTQALITSVPLFSIFLIFSGNLLLEKDIRVRILSLFSILVTIFTCLALNQKDIGIIWGPRHFLVLFPVIIVLVLFCVEKISVLNDKPNLRKLFQTAAVLLFFSSLLIQAQGMKTLFNKKIYSENLVSKLSVSNNIIATDVFWIPEEISSLYFQKKIMQVQKSGDLEKLKELLKESGCDKFTFVLSPSYRLIKNEDMAAFMKGVKITSKQMINYTKVSFMSLMVLECELETAKINTEQIRKN